MVAAGLLLQHKVAHAQASPPTTSVAKQLFDQATQEMTEGLYATACPKFEAAQKLDPNHVRTAISLAKCNDEWGKPATALEQLTTARQLAEAKSDQNKVQEIDGILAGLNPRVPKLRIIVPEKIALWPGLTVLRDGVTVPHSQWGQDIAVNPGIYKIEVSGLGRKTWKTTAEALKGATVVTTLAPRWKPLETVEPAKEPPPVVEKKPDPVPVVEKPRVKVPPPKKPSKPPTPAEREASSRRDVGIAGIGVGGSVIFVGSILGGLAISRFKESNNGHCSADNRCNDYGFNERTEALALANTSTAMFVVGGLLFSAGVVLVLSAPSAAKSTENRARTSLWMGPGSVGVQGQW